jgi:hypothetical protein
MLFRTVREKRVNQDPSYSMPTIIRASRMLLRQRPALWVAGFLAGVLVALTIATHATAWETGNGLQAVLALGAAGLALPIGWVALECSRQILSTRQDSSKE